MSQPPFPLPFSERPRCSPSSALLPNFRDPPQPRGLGAFAGTSSSPIGIEERGQTVLVFAGTPFAKIPRCTVVALRVLRLMDLQKAIGNQPTSFSDIIEQHGGSTESHTFPPQGWGYKWGRCRRFQAEPPWEVSITRGEYGMFLKHLSIGSRVGCAILGLGEGPKQSVNLGFGRHSSVICNLHAQRAATISLHISHITPKRQATSACRPRPSRLSKSLESVENSATSV